MRIEFENLSKHDSSNLEGINQRYESDYQEKQSYVNEFKDFLVQQSVRFLVDDSLSRNEKLQRLDAIPNFDFDAFLYSYLNFVEVSTNYINALNIRKQVLLDQDQIGSEEYELLDIKLSELASFSVVDGVDEYLYPELIVLRQIEAFVVDAIDTEDSNVLTLDSTKLADLQRGVSLNFSRIRSQRLRSTLESVLSTDQLRVLSLEEMTVDNLREHLRINAGTLRLDLISTEIVSKLEPLLQTVLREKSATIQLSLAIVNDIDLNDIFELSRIINLFKKVEFDSSAQENFNSKVINRLLSLLGLDTTVELFNVLGYRGVSLVGGVFSQEFLFGTQTTQGLFEFLNEINSLSSLIDRNTVFRLLSYREYGIDYHSESDDLQHRYFPGRYLDHNIFLDVMFNQESQHLSQFASLSNLEGLATMLGLDSTSIERSVFIDVNPALGADSRYYDTPGAPLAEVAEFFPGLTCVGLADYSSVQAFLGRSRLRRTQGGTYKVSEGERARIRSLSNTTIISGEIDSMSDNLLTSQDILRQHTLDRETLSSRDLMIIRVANSLDIYNNADNINNLFQNLSRVYRNKALVIFFNRSVLIKPKGKSEWREIASLSPRGFDHLTRRLDRHGEMPFTLTQALPSSTSLQDSRMEGLEDGSLRVESESGQSQPEAEAAPIEPTVDLQPEAEAALSEPTVDLQPEVEQEQVEEQFSEVTDEAQAQQLEIPEYIGPEATFRKLRNTIEIRNAEGLTSQLIDEVLGQTPSVIHVDCLSVRGVRVLREYISTHSDKLEQLKNIQFSVKQQLDYSSFFEYAFIADKFKGFTILRSARSSYKSVARELARRFKISRSSKLYKIVAYKGLNNFSQKFFMGYTEGGWKYVGIFEILRSINQVSGMDQALAFELAGYKYYEITVHADSVFNRSERHRLQDHEAFMARLFNDESQNTFVDQYRDVPHLNALYSKLGISRPTQEKTIFFDIGPGIAPYNRPAAVTTQEMAERFRGMQTIALDLPENVHIYLGDQSGNNGRYRVTDEQRREFESHDNLDLIGGNGLHSLRQQYELMDRISRPYQATRERPSLDQKELVVLRSANAVDLYCDWPSNQRALQTIASDFPNQAVIYFYNKTIIFKAKGEQTWHRFGEFSDRGHLHNGKVSAYDRRNPIRTQIPYSIDRTQMASRN
jgi:hypothetical protein